MCVIAYKPNNINFPSDTILKNCYDNNPDGAGFMYVWQKKVYIQKGYTSWTAFKNALDKARIKTGDKVPYVMHFRIATQGYEKTMTHPFPLSSNMKALKKTKYDCNIGVAHNGILEITSDGAKDYSDTMKFITDYLSLIIRGYSWYKDDRTKLLIERLIDGSRLAILDKNGHCELMGKGWVEEKGMFYSNNSYSYKKVSYPVWDGWDDGYFWHGKTNKTEKYKEPPVWIADPWEKYYNDDTGEYDFHGVNCPEMMEGDGSYCGLCSRCSSCGFMNCVSDIK